jgi:tetratricopeptide (TPR) repeat protein
LASYDTRLWFVLFFIPIIPLGRKRIINYCPTCTRHHVLELDKWEAAKQLEISGALEKFRTNPGPESAIEAHQALIGFHQMAQAAEFRQVMREKYADSAKVQSYLGAILTHLGQLEEAGPYFERALALRPDLPEARVGVAEAHIRGQRLDEARKLLDFLEKPGANQLYSLEPLENLANAYQQASRHREALELFGKLLEALPHVAEHSGFRKRVEQSEKALGMGSSRLPKRKFSWRRFLGADPTAPRPAPRQTTLRGLLVVGGITALVLLGFIVANEYTRRHRTLYVVNETGQPATVEVRGAGRVQVARGYSELNLPEGTYHAIVSGARAESVDFDVRSGYFDRWFGNPAWVLNVGGAAILMVTSAEYSRDATPPTYSFRFGQTFERFPEITHPFTPLPESLSMKSHERRTLTQLDLFGGEAVQVFQHFMSKGQSSDALRLAESRLRWRPDDNEMMHSYMTTVRSQRQIARAENFFRAGLTNRPVQIEWHRGYQSLHKDREREARLVKDYDAMLQSEPGNSALMYLRGRVTPDRAEARRWFDRAREADPQNPFPYYAIGYERIGLGDWAGARPLFARAAELRPTDSAFVRYLGLVRYALGEFPALEEEHRARLKREPVDFLATVQLCDVLVAADKRAEAEQAVQSFERAATARHGAAARAANNMLRRRLLYELGDFAALEKHAASDRSPAGRAMLFHALIEQGKIADAVKIDPVKETDEEELPFHFLTVELAWTLAGNAEEANRWQDRAVAALEAGDDDFARAATLLRGNAAPAGSELDSVIVPSNSKAILLAMLAQKFPAKRGELAAMARKMNVDRSFPYHLIQRATGASR